MPNLYIPVVTNPTGPVHIPMLEMQPTAGCVRLLVSGRFSPPHAGDGRLYLLADNVADDHYHSWIRADSDSLNQPPFADHEAICLGASYEAQTSEFTADVSITWRDDSIVALATGMSAFVTGSGTLVGHQFYSAFIRPDALTGFTLQFNVGNYMIACEATFRPYQR